MKKIIVAVCAIVCCLKVYPQLDKIDSSRLLQIGPHYVDEYAFDVSGDEIQWSKQSAGLHAGFGSEDELYFRRHGSWAAGDCFLVYPGGNSCIRYEKLRETEKEFDTKKITADVEKGKRFIEELTEK